MLLVKKIFSIDNHQDLLTAQRFVVTSVSLLRLHFDLMQPLSVRQRGSKDLPSTDLTMQV